jgi:PDDEXK-like domain of unknown function (DUF3799)
MTDDDAIDGFARPPAAHVDGIYLDLPLGDYLADRALSGSAFKRLLSDPAALTWESEANPLWLHPERAANRPRLRGSAAHCAILEGLEAYEARYAVKPEGVMSTSAELKRWLSAKRAEFIAASVDSKLSKADREAVKQTGEFDELAARVLALDPKASIWALDDDTETLHPSDDQYVRLLERFVGADPAFAPLVSDGLAELSIFWTEGDLRFKARIDYLNAHTLLDLKTFGQPPKRGFGLREHCVREACWNGYDLQAVHNARAAEAAADRLGGENFGVRGARGREQSISAYALFSKLRAKRPVFRWLFVRMGGAPTGISIPFRESDGQWQEARAQIDEACALYRQLRARFGDDLWIVSHGEQEIEDQDWPLAAIGGAG